MKDVANTGAETRASAALEDAADAAGYRLDEQVGYLLRRAQQRHLAIFAREIPELTPRQFAAVAKCVELGPVSQADLGRATGMDAATVKGVVDRLEARGLVATAPCAEDGRRVLVRLTVEGARLFAALAPRARSITAETLAPLSAAEGASLLRLLRKMA